MSNWSDSKKEMFEIINLAMDSRLPAVEKRLDVIDKNAQAL